MKLRRIRPGLMIAVFLVSGLARAQSAAEDYTLGPKDLLDIRVFEIPELNLERRVSDSGAIDLPLLGEINVSGLTATQVRARLESLLTAKYVNRANVSVVVKEFANKPVSILGAVEKPGSLNISGRWTLLQAISAAGGLTGEAGKRIYVIRRAENGLSDILEIKSEDLFQASSGQWNIPLAPGDIVNVQAKRQVKVFCLGEVKSPGSLEFDGDDRISLLSAIAKAGGLTDRASSKIRVKRRGSDGKDKEIVADFKRIVSGKDSDLTLQPDDVVIVRESFF
ncbi:MAG TPA: polysaccharide biosynthesis/export family protein [Thermoanaerobaculia bacterium]|nr:polysaccharide biosynthesis/export family protein [Thermoanaerobaculia bacterium]